MDANLHNQAPAARAGDDAAGGVFRWRHCSEPDQVRAAVDTMMRVLKGPRARQWNPHTEAYTRAVLQRRIRRAAAGELGAFDEVKRLYGRFSGVKLYEIRWADLRTNVLDPDSGDMVSTSLAARLYYLQEDSTGHGILGLHCHEQPAIADEAGRQEAQGLEIANALEVYLEDVTQRWYADQPVSA